MRATRYYLYSGDFFNDECIKVFEDVKSAKDYRINNGLWDSYIVDCTDRYIGGSYNSYRNSFNCHYSIG